MWEKLKNRLLLRFKALEFQLKTWKNAREISKAYDQSGLLKPVKSIDYKKIVWQFSRFVILVTTVFAIGIFMIYGISKLIVLHFSANPEAAVLDLEIPHPEKTDLYQKKIHGNDSIAKQNDLLLKKSIYNSDQPISIVAATQSSDFIIVANKADKQMFLLQKQDNEWKIIRKYNMAIGAKKGRKEYSGDKRTPEGTYFIIGRKEGRELSSIYGPLAYILNYPNDEDIRAGRTGSGIWIHGTEKDSAPFQTRGCLEISNENLIDLSSLLKKGIGTAVLIIDSTGTPNPLSVPEYSLLNSKKDNILKWESVRTELFSNLLSDWKTAWESEDINIYRNFYDTSSFKGQGLNWNSWEKRKLQTFQIYKKIEIDIDSIFVSDISPNYAVIKFLQSFKTDKNLIEDGKVIHFKKENDSWKITQENTCPKEEILL